MKTQAEYHNDEVRRLHKQLQEVETAPLQDRQDGRASWAEMLTQYPEILTQRVSWLFAGNYGYGAMIRAQEIARNKRSNRPAALGQLMAALEWQCPANFAREAFVKLPAGKQVEINVALTRLADEFLKGEEK